ncbi:MAG: hypothetical protein KTR30_30005 [Saprospiraceae bacterium]|nr:hypothetical protein [Saprospiraceae bacterium]
MKSTLIILSLVFLFGVPQTEENSPNHLERPIHFKGDVDIANTQKEIVVQLSNIAEVYGGPVHMPYDYKSDRIFVLQQMPNQKKFARNARMEDIQLTYFRNVLEIREGNKPLFTFGLGNDVLHPDAQQRLETITRSDAKVEPYLGIGLAMMPKRIPDFGTFMEAHSISIYQNENSAGGVDCSQSIEYSGGGHGAMASSVNENTVYCLEEFNACSSKVEARCCTFATTPGAAE